MYVPSWLSWICVFLGLPSGSCVAEDRRGGWPKPSQAQDHLKPSQRDVEHHCHRDRLLVIQPLWPKMAAIAQQGSLKMSNASCPKCQQAGPGSSALILLYPRKYLSTPILHPRACPRTRSTPGDVRVLYLYLAHENVASGQVEELRALTMCCQQ